MSNSRKQKPDGEATLAVVPRAVATAWSARPWSEVMAAIEIGELRALHAPTYRGIPCQQLSPKDDGLPRPGFEDWADVVLLRCGESGILKGKTLWFQQNW
jgi:hypothetical protein